MKFFISIIFLLYAFIGFSQEGLFSSGSYASNSQANLTWSLGEAVIFTGETESMVVTQGMNQTYFVITPVTDPKTVEHSVKIFPNPTPDKIYISSKSNETISKIIITDLKGNTLATLKGGSANHVIDIRGLHQEALQITIITSSDIVETYKVVKIQ